jgi:hypothetical protein
MERTLIPRQAAGFEITELPDGAVIRRGDTVHSLNTTALEIFRLCDGEHTIGEIIDEIIHSYPEENIETFVKDFIELMNSSSLIGV